MFDKFTYLIMHHLCRQGLIIAMQILNYEYYSVKHHIIINYVFKTKILDKFVEVVCGMYSIINRQVQVTGLLQICNLIVIMKSFSEEEFLVWKICGLIGAWAGGWYSVHLLWL